MLLAAAERRLPKELHRRARSLAEDGNDAFALCARPGSRPGVAWRGHRVARLVRGRDLLRPKVEIDRSLPPLPPDPRKAAAGRLPARLASDTNQRPNTRRRPAGQAAGRA